MHYIYHVCTKLVSICAVALLTSANAFTVSLPSGIRATQLFAMGFPAVAAVLATATQANDNALTIGQISSSTLPSRKDLLSKDGTLTLASSSAPKAINVAAGSEISINDIYPKIEAENMS